MARDSLGILVVAESIILKIQILFLGAEEIQ